MFALGCAFALAACAPAKPAGTWHPRQERINRGSASCAPPEASSEGRCIGAPVPASPAEGPRMLLGDTAGLGPIAVVGEAIFYGAGPRGHVESVCRLPKQGGPPTCFASFSPFSLLALDTDEDRLFGLVTGTPDRAVITRFDRVRGDVDYLSFLEEGEWALSLAASAGDSLCAVVARPGPGHAERAVVRIPKAGGPRTVLVPFGHVQGDALACDATDAYFAGDSGLERVPLRGGMRVALGTSAFRIALGPRDVYVAGMRGIERLPKGSTAVTLVAPVAHSGLGWDPVRELRAFPGGVAWREHTHPHDRGDETASALRWCREARGCETIVESSDDITLEAAQDGVAYWTVTTKTRYGTARVLHAARGPLKLKVAGEGQ
ncbi:hypothetical protein A7982_13936 [Minicystis rosea]|nr:hypothetical protein A7982_13936 [Minicystis rosea]